jgi:hypothetical protein
MMVEIIETQKILNLVSEHPVMSRSLRQKEASLKAQLDNVSVNQKETNLVLLTTEESKTLTGVLKGILLESWKFDFMDEQGTIITGSIDETLTEEQVTNFNTRYFNKACKVILKEGKVLFKNGRERISYVLSGIEPIEA